MTKFDFIKNWCSDHKHEVVLRYDSNLNEWLLHLYPAGKGSVGKHVLFRVKALDIGIDTLIGIITKENEHGIKN